MIRPPLSLAAAILAVVALAAPPAAAQTWTGLISGSWNFGANWSPNAAPASSANTVLTFGTASITAMTQDINTTFQLNIMNFQAGGPAYTLTGGGLQFVNSSGPNPPHISFDTASTVTLGNTLTLGNNLTVFGSGSGTLNGSVNSSNGNLTYAGAGTLTLGGSTDNVGLGVFVNSGTVVLAKTSASSPAVHAVGGGGLTTTGGTVQLGGTGGDQIFNSANVTVSLGTFDANGASETFATLSVQGAGIGGNGALVNTAAGTSSVLTPSSVMLTGNTSVGAFSNATLAINGPIVGNFGLTKVGAGTVILGSTSNSYSGGTIVNGGTLALGTGTAIPAGSNVTVNAGQFNVGGLSNAAAIGTLTVAGTGVFRAPSGVGDYNINRLVMNGGSLDFSGSTDYYLHLTGSGAGITINSAVTWVGSGTSRIRNDTAAPIDLIVLGTLTSSLMMANGASSQGFHITGGGTYSPTNIDNSATLIVEDAVLRVADVAAVGSGPLTLATFGGIFYTGPTATLSKSFTFGSIGGGVATTASAILTLSGNIGGSGPGNGLTVIGDPSGSSQGGTVTLTGTNTYTGPTHVSFGGVLSIGSITNGGVAGPLGTSSNSPVNLVIGGVAHFASVDFGGGGTLRYTGPTASTDRGVSLADTSGSPCVLEVTTAATNLTFTGLISGPGALTKAGPGTLILTNTANDYAGGTFVNAGRLALGDSDRILPPGSSVTVAAGAELDTGSPATFSDSNALGTLALNGGTFRVAASIQYLNKLTTNSNGGTVTGGASSYTLAFINDGAGITANGNTSITGPTGSLLYPSFKPAIPISVAPGVTLTTNLAVAGFNLSGGGTMNVTGGAFIFDPAVVSNAKLRIDDLISLQTNNLTLDAGTLQYGGPTATLSRPFNLGAGGGTLEVLNAATTLTLTSAITGGGPFTKAGPGVLAFNTTANLYAGGITVAAGRLDVSNDAQLGLANPTVNAAGTLRYTASTTTGRTFNLIGGTLEAAAGTTVTYSGANISGGFLRGAGTHAMTGGTALAGVSTFNSTTISVTGPASFTNFSNAGTLMLATGVTSLTFNGFINQGSGAITLGATSAVSLSDVQTYGTLTINPAPITQNFSQTTLMTNAGTSPLFFNGGSRTFVGTPSTAVFPSNWPDVSLRGTPTFVAGIDLNGKNAVVAGGLFVNNGYVEDSSNGFGGTATIVADFGALVKGSGFFQNTVLTQNGGKFQAGNSPGSATFGHFVLGPGGVSSYVFAIDDANGAAGPTPDAAGHVSGWGLVKVGAPPVTHGRLNTQGDFVWTATSADKLLVSLETLVNPTPVGTDVPGLMDDFDPTRSYVWLAVEWTGSYAGPADVAVLNAATAFDTSGFANPVTGTFGWSLDPMGHSLSLTYTPTAVPEPGTLILSGMAAIGWVTFWRGRWQSNSPPATLSV